MRLGAPSVIGEREREVLQLSTACHDVLLGVLLLLANGGDGVEDTGQQGHDAAKQRRQCKERWYRCTVIV